MKRFDSKSEDSRGGESEGREMDPLAGELDAYVEAGMKEEALRFARKIFGQTRPSAQAFASALVAILTLVNRLTPWGSIVRAGYARLGKLGQRSCRWLMLHFNCANHDYK